MTRKIRLVLLLGGPVVALLLAVTAVMLHNPRFPEKQEDKAVAVPSNEQAPEAIEPEMEEETDFRVFRSDVRLPSGGSSGKNGSPENSKLIDLDDVEDKPPFRFPVRDVPKSDEEALRHLAELESSGQGFEREAFAASLVRVLAGDSQRLGNILGLIQRTEDPEIRRLGIILIGRVDSQKAIEWLGQLARFGQDITLRKLAIDSLLQEGRPKDDSERHAAEPKMIPIVNRYALSMDRVGILIDVLTNERDPSVLISVVGLLTYRQNLTPDHSQITDVLCEMISQEDDPARLSTLLDGLVGSQSARARDTTMDVLLHAKDPEVLRAGLSSLGTKEDTPVTLEFKLRLAMEHKDESVREQAVKAIRIFQQDGRHLIGNLHAVLDRIGPGIVSDPSRRVRIAGMPIFYRSGLRGRGYLESLAQSDPDKSVREAARNWLERPQPRLLDK